MNTFLSYNYLVVTIPKRHEVTNKWLTPQVSSGHNAAKQVTSKNNIHILRAKEAGRERDFNKFYKEGNPVTNRQTNVLCLGNQKNKVLI
jgi:hypothetical protein